MADPLERLSTALADRYTLQRELGRGDLATVYLVEDVESHTGGPADAAELLPANRPPPTTDFLCYVMPYLEGESPRDRLTREQQLPLDDALSAASPSPLPIPRSRTWRMTHGRRWKRPGGRRGEGRR